MNSTGLARVCPDNLGMGVSHQQGKLGATAAGVATVSLISRLAVDSFNGPARDEQVKALVQFP
jgi:hypothetical protein